jgi:hypothetical protein
MELAITEPRKAGRPRGPSRQPAMPGYFTEAEQAARLGISVDRLRGWRREGKGPKSVPVGRSHLYAHGADEQWLAAQQEVAEQRRSPRGRGRPRLQDRG